MTRLKWLRRRAARHGLQNRRFDFQKTALFQKSTRFAKNCNPLEKNGARLFVRDQIEITLAITRFDILQPMPLFRQRPQRFREHFELLDLQCRLAGFGQETFAFHADEIAQIEQLEKIDNLRANFFGVDVNLNPAGRVAKIDKVALAHVAVRGNAAGRAQGFAFLEFFPDLRQVAACFEGGPEGFHATRAQTFQFSAPLRDQFILVVHFSQPSLNRINGLNRCCLIHFDRRTFSIFRAALPGKFFAQDGDAQIPNLIVDLAESGFGKFGGRRKPFS